MLTGKQIKAVSKGHTGIMIRFKGQYGITLEGHTRPMGGGADLTTTMDDRSPTDWDGCYLGMYAMAYDSTWHFFQQSLRPTDEVHFVVRNNGSQFTEEAGMIVEEIRAVINRPSKSGGRQRQFQMTLSSSTMGADNCTRIKSIH